MAYVRKFTEETYNKMMKEGRGQGEFEKYKPWILVPNVRSKGWKDRELGKKIAREHHFLSQLESDYFYMAEFCPHVIDIREQYPLLPRGRTSLIAETVGITHPRDTSTGVKTPVTTDFLLTMKINRQVFYLARTIKQVVDLEDYRVIEKFEIERRYWRDQGISWGIVTDKEIKKYEVFVLNIINVRAYHSLNNVEGVKDLPEQEIKYLTGKLKEKIVGVNKVVNEVTSNFELKYGLRGGVGLAIFKHLVYHRQIGIDLYTTDIKLSLDSAQSIKLL